MNIEKMLFPNANKLKRGKAVIIDAESDPVNCKFNDGCVVLDTKKSAYLMLSTENLKQLIAMIKENDR